MTDALDAVIDAALERALLEANDARRYFALAGALERGRSAARTDGAGIPQHEHGDPARERSNPPEDSTDALGAALLSTVAIGALGSTSTDDIDPDAWSPDDRDGGPHVELVAAGAATACRRFDVEAVTVAARTGISSERIARHQGGDDATIGPK